MYFFQKMFFERTSFIESYYTRLITSWVLLFFCKQVLKGSRCFGHTCNKSEKFVHALNSHRHVKIHDIARSLSKTSDFTVCPSSHTCQLENQNNFCNCSTFLNKRLVHSRSFKEPSSGHIEFLLLPDI